MSKNNNSSEFPWQAMLIVSCLGLIGILMLFISGCFNIKNYDELYMCFSDYGLAIIFGMFFVGVSIYCWILFFRNVVLKPKKVTLYLLGVEDSKIKFIDKKGKVFLFYNFNTNIIDVGKYYYVLKTHNSIKEILNESYETFKVVKEKKSYWLNFYSPIGNFEDMLLLPILYIILLPGILSIIMSDGFTKIYGIIYSIFPFLILIYDFIYKYKLNNNKDEIDNIKILKFYALFLDVIKIIAVVVINVGLLYIYINTFDYISKFIILPFCLCSLCVFGDVISKILNNNSMVKFFNKCYIFMFILYLIIFFSMLIFNF